MVQEGREDIVIENGAGEICKFFMKGSCTKGASCPFKHTKGDRAVVCKHWLRGLCKKGDNCEFLHEYDLSKMPECYFFSKFGECSNPECMYLHINPEDKMKECPWYARGFCKHGNRCRHKHVKRIACANYILGFCPDGPSCKFGHPKFELPADDIEQISSIRKTPVVCRKCGVLGHKASNCPTHKDEKTGERPPIETVTCYRCGKLGHYANKCPMSMYGQAFLKNTAGMNEDKGGEDKDREQKTTNWLAKDDQENDQTINKITTQK